MRRYLFALAAFVTAVHPHGSIAAPPKKHRVSFYGAVVGPAKINGDPWDAGCDKVSQQSLDDLSKALRAVPSYVLGPSAFAVQIAPLVAKWASKPLCKPDPKGTVELLGASAVSSSRTLGKVQDTFTPDWDISWTGVSLADKTRLKVVLVDADLANDDPICTLEIGTDRLADAARARSSVHVAVGDQCSRQLLFIKIAVAEE